MTTVKRIKVDDVAYDLDNRSITLNATSGTLTEAELATLQASPKNYIEYNNGLYRLVYADSIKLYYKRDSAESNSANQFFTITISTGVYTYDNVTMATQAYVNSAIGDAMAASY